MLLSKQHLSRMFNCHLWVLATFDHGIFLIAHPFSGRYPDVGLFQGKARKVVVHRRPFGFAENMDGLKDWLSHPFRV